MNSYEVTGIGGSDNVDYDHGGQIDVRLERKI